MKPALGTDAALLIIDVQQALCCGESAAFEAERVIGRINEVSERCRRTGRPVVVIQHETADGPLQFASPGWQIADAEHVARAIGAERFISAQNHLNLLDRRAELEVLPAAEAYGLGVLPYFPLANGLLSGKYRRGEAPAGSRLTHSRRYLLETADWDQLERFSAFASERGMTEIEVAFSWLASRPQVASVIAGATKPEQIRANVGAAAWQLTHADLAAINAILDRPR